MPLSWSCHFNLMLRPIRYVFLPMILYSIRLFTTASISVLANYRSTSQNFVGMFVWHRPIYGTLNKASVTQLLQLVCRAIHCMQSDGCCTHLPNTINILNTLRWKFDSPCWASNAVVCFCISIYGFLCASKYLNLRWSDITQTDKITLTLHQSNTDPFWKCHQVLIFPTNILSHHKLFCCMLL